MDRKRISDTKNTRPLKGRPKSIYLSALLRVLLGALFVYAAVPKIADPFSFAVDVYNYRLLPGWAVGVVAAGLPWLELAAGACLLLGVRVRAAALLITGMLLLFTAAMLINTIRGLDVSCGCFTVDRTIGWSAVAEDAALTLCALWCLVKARHAFCLENLLRS